MAANLSRSRAVPEPEAVRPLDWLRFARVHQWSKNLLVLLPLLLSHGYGDPVSVAACALGFLSLSLVASGTYIVNDLLDLESDRAHPTKRMRLLASGRIGPEAASVAAALLACGGFAVAATLGPGFFATVLVYAVSSAAYSLRLKSMPMVDVVFLGLLYTLRVAIGTELAGGPQSAWLLSFSALFFTSLAFAKRHAEVHAASQGLVALHGRGYRPGDWPLTLACGIGSLSACVVVLVLYLSEQMGKPGLYERPGILWIAPVLTTVWSLRIWLLSHRGELQGDPVSFALRDRASLALGAAALADFLAASL